MPKPPTTYWSTNIYPSPKRRPKADAPARDLPKLAAGRFRKARAEIRALRHVTEQVVFLGMTWKWVWMYEVGGRKLGFLHPMGDGVSGTFLLTATEHDELTLSDGLRRPVRHAVRDGDLVDGVRWCWMEFPDQDAVDGFVDVIRLKHHLLARPE